MAQPPTYTPAHEFLTDEVRNVDFPGTEIDIELNALKATLDEVLANLALIQRDDGALANEIVTWESLDDELREGVFAPLGAWDDGVVYRERQLVVANSKLYRCLVEHTSTVFATNLAQGKWVLVAELPTGDSATVAIGTVTEVAHGEPPTVVNVGSASAVTLNFEFPAPGDVGAPTTPVTIGHAVLFANTDGDVLDSAGFAPANVVHTHDDRYFTESEVTALIDAALVAIRDGVSASFDTLAELATALGGKSDTGHTHDDRYFTEAEVTSALSAKLDAVSYTAADVLAKLLTVDGAASGLDADLLDGQSSAFYATASGLADHLADTSAAHAASAISYAGGTGLSATDVEAAIDELATEKLDSSAAAYTLAARNAGTTGNMAAMDVTALTEKSIPVAADWLLLVDTEASNAFKKVKNINVGPPILRRCLASDATGQNVNSAQPWFPTNGAATLLSAKTYRFRGLLYTSRAAGTTSHTTQISFTGTATLASIMAHVTVNTGDTAASEDTNRTLTVTGGNTTVKAASTSATEQTTILVEGVVRVTTTGTFQPNFRYSAAPGGAPTIKANSFFELEEVESDTFETTGTWT